ncbi:MAG: HAD-IA family hydrolase [Methylobacteriaceae bacterium]|jgi:beta-phosphoglucomutase|nr:HAD-IA family hydrolase [Methylobacteriaceae bacterium]
MTLKALLFDFDGTLANTDPIHLAVFKELLAPQGIVVDAPYFRKNIAGGSNKELFKRYFPGIGDEEAMAMSEAKEQMFRDRVGDLKPISGLHECLDWAREQGLKTALVTNAPISNINHLLPVLNLTDVFDIQITGNDNLPGKPSPVPYLTALQRLDIAPGEAVVFEDTHTGIVSGVAAGIFTFGLMTTHPLAELEASGADAVIRDYLDPMLWTMLARMVAL